MTERDPQWKCALLVSSSSERIARLFSDRLCRALIEAAFDRAGLDILEGSGRDGIREPTRLEAILFAYSSDDEKDAAQ